MRKFIAEVQSAGGFVAIVPAGDDAGFDVLADAREICWLHWAQDGAPKGAVYRVVSYDPTALRQAQAVMASLPSVDVPVDMTRDEGDEEFFDADDPHVAHREFLPFGDLVFAIEHIQEMVLDADAALPVGSLEHVNQCRAARKLPPVASLDDLRPEVALKRALKRELNIDDPDAALDTWREFEAREHPRDYQ